MVRELERGMEEDGGKTSFFGENQVQLKARSQIDSVRTNSILRVVSCFRRVILDSPGLSASCLCRVRLLMNK